MKQPGNLAVLCAQRKDVLLQILDGKATMFTGEGACRRSRTADWSDDMQMNRLIYDLNFGELSEGTHHDTTN